jgi:hypothetical protein
MPSDITNATLAQKINALVDLWRTRELQMVAWLAGVPGGGDQSNGTYPLSDYLGAVTYVKSPAELAAEVTNTVTGGAAQASAAAASATAAGAAQAAAQTARDLALSYQTGAQAARDLALSYRNNAADSASSALFSQNASAASQTAAATSETNAGTSATTAATSASGASSSASAAAASATAAAASASAAATFDPANFYTKTVADGRYRLSSVAITSGDITSLAWGKLTGISVTDAMITGLSWGKLTGVPAFATVATSGNAGDLTGTLADVRLTANVSMRNAANTFSGATTFSAATSFVGSTWHTSTENALRFYFANNATSYWASPTGHEWRGPSQATLATLDGSGNLAASGYVQAAGAVYSNGGTYYTSSSSRQAITDASDGYLRLNNSSQFSNGVYTPGALRASGTITGDGVIQAGGAITSGTDISAIGGFRWASDSNFYFYNTSGYSFGSWRVHGSRNGYMGIVLDDSSRQPTFMSNGSTTGVYNQGASPNYWTWNDNGSAFTIGRRPTVDIAGQSGGAIPYFTGGQTGGRIYVQQGGAAAGTQEGDITLIW